MNYFNKLIDHASKAIKGIKPKGKIINNATRILTGYSEISIPKQIIDIPDKKNTYYNMFMKEVGLNIKAKYVKQGIHNCK